MRRDLKERQEREWAELLTRIEMAEKSDSPRVMRTVVRQCVERFEAVGWPDWWSRAQRLADDADALERARKKSLDI